MSFRFMRFSGAAIVLIDKPRPGRLPAKTKSPSRTFACAFSSASAAGDSGTRCSRAALILDAGMVQVAVLRSISDHVAPVASLVLAAVRIVNSRQRAAVPFSRAKRRHKFGDLFVGQSRVVLDQR